MENVTRFLHEANILRGMSGKLKVFPGARGGS